MLNRPPADAGQHQGRSSFPSMNIGLLALSPFAFPLPDLNVLLAASPQRNNFAFDIKFNALFCMYRLTDSRNHDASAADADC